jgi:thiamine pyrophosphokinase
VEQIDTVVVFSGGPAPPARVAAAIPAGAPVIAADLGAAHALRLGLSLSAVVGDLDSLDAATLRALRAQGTRIDAYPTNKDASDLALALDAAVELAPRRILVIGATTGRFDHVVAQPLLLASDAYAGIELDALLGSARLHVIRGERRLHGRVRALISLFAVNGPARGVRSEGLAYPLRGEELPAGSTRGLSNIFSFEQASLTVGEGVVLALVPGRLVTRGQLNDVLGSVQGGNASSSRRSPGSSG